MPATWYKDGNGWCSDYNGWGLFVTEDEKFGLDGEWHPVWYWSIQRFQDDDSEEIKRECGAEDTLKHAMLAAQHAADLTN